MIQLQNICWETPDHKQVLKNISLKIPENRLVAITGPNGGGKTSLARLLMGIEKPSAGKIILDDEDITSLNVTERAKKGISFAFQQPVRFKGITVKQLIETASGETIRKDELCQILQKVGLCANDYLNREIDSTLSGGEIKRIEIASVLARHSRLSIFDEPEAGIDLWSFQNLIQVFNDMRKHLSGNLIIISHQERILEIADEIIMIADGTLVDKGPGPEMMAKMTSEHCTGKKCCNRKEFFHE